jgi:hypothetical protein
MEKDLAGSVVICELWRLAIVLVVPSGVYKWSVNPFTNPNPVYNHPLSVTTCTSMYFFFFVSSLCLRFIPSLYFIMHTVLSYSAFSTPEFLILTFVANS